MGVKAAFTAELDLKFFARSEFESRAGLGRAEQIPVIVRNVLRILMMGWTSEWTKLLTSTAFRAIYVKRNPLFLMHMRHAFQEGFNHLFEQLKDNNLNEAQREQVHLYLSNCLSVLPFSDLTPYESIKIPQYINNQWELVEYLVTPIELTPKGRLDQDRVFAYGLEPLFQRHAESHLLFMGTTYPAGQGFITQIDTDAKGFESVGEALYKTGRERIQQWLSSQANKIHVCGMSLGGSLSLLLAIDQCDSELGSYELSRVDALNPAGLHDSRTKMPFDHWDELPKKPLVVVQKQGDDPVSYFGVWKEDWDILEVNPPADKKGPNGFADHALNYAGFKGTQFTYVDAKKDNAQRNRRNFWLFSVGRTLLYYNTFVPFAYVIRPIGLFLAKNWPLLILVPTVALAAYFAIISIAVAAVVTAIAVTAALVARFLGKQSEPSFAKLHDPKLSRNEDMNIYSESNAVELELTYKDINTYYQAIRSSKQKEFLPADERPSKHVKGMTKRDLLAASQEPGRANEVVSLHVTKAKAAHIHHTLSLVHRLGLENKERLNPDLKTDYEYYARGKVSV